MGTLFFNSKTRTNLSIDSFNELGSFYGNSKKAAELLVKNGFEEAYAITGGLRGKMDDRYIVFLQFSYDQIWFLFIRFI